MYLFCSRRLKIVGVSFLFCIISMANLKAQNLVSNPSFENVNAGSLQCSWYTTAGQFNNAINDWTCPTGGSTDIFNTALATTCYCSPFSTHASSVGQQAPRTGNGFVNIVTYGNGGCDPWREYVQGTLTTPLVAGQTYEVEMYVSLADNMTVGTNNIGVKFSTAPYTQASNCGYYTAPDLNYTGPIITDKANWTQIIFCYTPTQSGLQHFIIGNFFNDAATATQAAGGGTGNTIRYFVDDVRIEQIVPGGGNPGTDGTTTQCATNPPVDLFNFLGGGPDITGTWTGPSALTGGYLGTFDPATNAPGVYTYTIPGGGPCVAGGGGSATVTVTIGSSDATVSPAGPFCFSDPNFFMTGADPGGTWSGPGITNTTTGEFDPSVAGAGSHTITYTISGACGDVQSTSVTVNPDLDATITPVGPFCETEPNLNLSAVDAGGTWSGNGITNAANGTFDPATAGPGTHTITYSIPGACGDVQTTTITVNDVFDATISPAGPFCDSDAAVNLTAVDAGGTWSGTGITNATNGTFDPVVAGQGTHAITYTIPGSCGDVDTENIVVNITKDASITPAGPFCDTDAALNLVGADPGGQWSGVGITNAASGTFDPTIAGPGTHTITYNIAGACGDVQTTDITVNLTPDPTVTPAGPFCDSDAAVNLTAVDAGGTWSGTGISNATNGTFDPVQAGQGTHTVTYTIPGSCGVSDTEDIVVNPTMDASITAVGPFCDTDAALNLVGVDPGGQWSGVGITNAALGTFDPTLAGAGIHTITYDITGACGDVQTTDITVNLTPDPTVNPAGPFCESDPIAVLSALSPGGVWSGNGITNPSTGEFDPVTAGDGTHLITYSVAGNCPVSGTATITVNALPILPTYVQQSVCNGSSLAVQAFNPQPSSATTNWVNTTGQDVGFGLNGNGDIGTFTANDPTNSGQIVQVDVTAVSVEGCSSLPESILIQINPTPNVMFYGVPLIGCEPLRVTFYNDTQVQGQSCLWDFGDGTTGSSCDSIEHVYMTGLFDVGLTVTTADGCTDNQIINQYIEVSPQPIAHFDLSPSVLITEDTEVQFTNNSLNATSYLWSFGDNHSSSDENPVHTYPQVAGTYIATMWAYSNNQLCVDSLQKPITIEDVLIYYVPNTITPDGDSYNEYFRPQFTSGFDFYDFHLTIFNRWGEVIFESYDATKGWNGHYGTGGIVEDGAYVWQIEFKETKTDKRYTERGHVTVLK